MARKAAPATSPGPFPPLESSLPPIRVPDDVQRLWFTLAQRPWSSLVVMPSDFRSSSNALAETLARAGTRAGASAVRFVDAQNVELSQVAQMIEEAAEAAQQSRHTIIAVNSPLLSPAAIPLALASDAVLLCVELGVSDVANAARTIELVGRQRFLGAVAISSRALP